ncbi:MAG: lipid-A-disaccharide synthase [Aquabacterium sp.]
MVAAAPLRVGMVAGEASGDLLGALLLQGLRGRWPQLIADGIGGPRLQAMGFRSDAPMERLSVFGYVDALRRLPELLQIRRRLGDRLIAERPALFIGVDAPDFNFGLEQRLRQEGLKTVHFVCPSIWAWRGERAARLKAAADHVLCLFPFEPPLLAAHGIAATYVGHPLADAITPVPDPVPSRVALGIDGTGPLVALLPGSRRSEIAHLAPVMLGAASLLRAQRPDTRFVLPAAPGLRDAIAALQQRWAPNLPVTVLDGKSHAALAACDVALVASGTATLEAALVGRPMVITYRMSWLNWQRMKRMAYQPWVGLPNIMAGEFVVPELIQDAATPEALASAALDWLDHPEAVASVRQRFAGLHAQLRQDTARKAGDAIATLLAA